MRGGILLVVALAACSPRSPIQLDGASPADGAVRADGAFRPEGPISPPDLGCLAPFVGCNGTCVDLTRDPQHCGMCGNRCEPGTTCHAGVCETVETCTDCGGSCIDFQSDNNNCGACGNACDATAGFVCQSGACSCTGGLVDCGGVCVDVSTDPMNCGTCGTACSSGEPCTTGTCTTPCAPGLVDCNGTCVDLATDNNNCGTCGTKCPSYGYCLNGVCGGWEPFVALTVTCPKTSLSVGDSMQCSAFGWLMNGATVPLTTQVSWSAVNSGCGAGVMSQPPGTFTALTAGCTAAISAKYTSASGTTITSNSVTVTVGP